MSFPFRNLHDSIIGNLCLFSLVTLGLVQIFGVLTPASAQSVLEVLPSEEEFIDKVSAGLGEAIGDYMGYAVPITATALLIRSSLK